MRGEIKALVYKNSQNIRFINEDSKIKDAVENETNIEVCLHDNIIRLVKYML